MASEQDQTKVDAATTIEGIAGQEQTAGDSLDVITASDAPPKPSVIMVGQNQWQHDMKISAAGRTDLEPLINDWRIVEITSKDQNGTVQHFLAEMDTGSDGNFISVEAVNRLGLTPEENPVLPVINMAHGSIRPEGMVKFQYHLGRHEETDLSPHEFWILRDLPRDIILGAQLLVEWNLITVNLVDLGLKPEDMDIAKGPQLCLINVTGTLPKLMNQNAANAMAWHKTVVPPLIKPMGR